MGTPSSAATGAWLVPSTLAVVHVGGWFPARPDGYGTGMTLRGRLVGIGALVGLLAAGLVGGLPLAEAAPTSWSVVHLDPLVAGENTEVFDVNNAGYSVGRSGQKAVYWDPAGDVHALPIPEGETESTAWAINDSGIIVGQLGIDRAERDAVAWVYGTRVPLRQDTSLVDISNSNVMAGCTGGPVRADQTPVVMAFGSAPIELSTDDDQPGCARSLNDWGAVGGDQGDIEGRVWYQSSAYGFDVDGGHVTTVTRTSNSGFALLQLTAEPDPSAATPTFSALAAPNGQIQVLDPSSTATVATDLNDYGIIVGSRAVVSGGNGSGAVAADSAEATMWVYGTPLPLRTIVDATGPDRALVDKSVPTALSESYYVVGNEAGQGLGSYLLVPAA
jgi:hypothetical protein